MPVAVAIRERDLWQTLRDRMPLHGATICVGLALVAPLPRLAHFA
jgi:hypothetical protein